ncbi:LOW QUALITY PROTEIN: hypothetical protein KUTeg_009614, partial [Tegillarca granosa]
MQGLIDLAPPRNNLSSFRNFYALLKRTGFEAIGQCSDNYGALLIPIIMNKLPVEVKQNLTREHGNNNWTLCELRKSISNEINITEAENFTEYGQNMPTASFLTTKLKHRYNNGNAQEQIKTMGILFEIHDPTKCTNVTEYDKRISIVKKKHLCFKCLVSECRSLFRCRDCKKQHHPSLCKKQASTNIAQKNSLRSSSVKEDNAENSVSCHSSSIQSRSNVLLKTAVSPVCSDRQCIESNILFDEGAQRSFITEELAGKPNAKETGIEAINLSAIGGSSNGT